MNKRVASAGVYEVRIAITTRRLTRNVVHLKIGALSRRAMTGRRGRATVTARLIIRSATLTIRAHARWTKPNLTVRLRRVGPLVKRPGGKTRSSGSAGPTGTTGLTGSTGLTVTTVIGSTGQVGSTGTTGPSTPTVYSHVVLAILESHDGPSAIAGAPYLAGLAAQGEYWPNYHGVSHPSEPNYMAIFSGSTQGQDGTDNCASLTATSLAGEALSAGVSIEGYMQDLVSGGLYACRHDPFSQFADARAHETDFSNFPTDYAALPQLSVVVPNTTNDAGDTGTIADANAWMGANLDAYAQWAKANNSLLLVVTDENDSDPSYSANQPGENGNGALAIAVGAGITPGSTNNTSYDHYSLLRTIEDIFGLGHLGASANAADLIAP